MLGCVFFVGSARVGCFVRAGWLVACPVFPLVPRVSSVIWSYDEVVVIVVFWYRLVCVRLFGLCCMYVGGVPAFSFSFCAVLWSAARRLTCIWLACYVGCSRSVMFV